MEWLAVKRCPKCRLINHETAQVCDCGWHPDSHGPDEPEEWTELQASSPAESDRLAIASRICVHLLYGVDYLYYSTLMGHINGLNSGDVGCRTRSMLDLFCICLVVLVFATSDAARSLPEAENWPERWLVRIPRVLGLVFVGLHVLQVFL